jgi:hypothetical protein
MSGPQVASGGDEEAGDGKFDHEESTADSRGYYVFYTNC